MNTGSRAGFAGVGAGRLVSVGLSLACLTIAAGLTPAARTETGFAPSPPSAGLGDAAVAALPSGWRRVLGDASWFLAVQYYGNRRLEGRSGFPDLGDLIEEALRLDPELRAAAVVGPLLLAEPRPLGAGEPERADRILNDWVRRHPGDFDAALVHGLLHIWHLGDPEAGARVLEAASAREGAPPWLRALAARSLAEVGARAAARDLWRLLLERAEDGRTRSNARTHLLQLDALDRLDELAAAVREYERRSGRPPGRWEDLVAAGLLPERPFDPAGVPFVLDESGLPGIAPRSPLAGAPGR